MRSDSYYNRIFVFVCVSIALIIYTISSTVIYSIVKDSYFNSSINYKKENIDLNTSIIKVDSYPLHIIEEEYLLSDLEYDINTLHIDWSEIEKAREKVKTNKTNNNYISVLRKNVGYVTPPGYMKLPNLSDSSFKGYMCMHKVTSKASKQWKFLHSGEFDITTDSNGIMMYKNYYIVAMGSYYTNYKIGSTFRVTLDSGVVFDVITGDEKADRDTDANNMYHPKGNNKGELIEFIIACGQEGKSCNKYVTLKDEYRSLGNLSKLGFQGSVIKIEKLNDYSVTDLLYC